MQQRSFRKQRRHNTEMDKFPVHDKRDTAPLLQVYFPVAPQFTLDIFDLTNTAMYQLEESSQALERRYEIASKVTPNWDKRFGHRDFMTRAICRWGVTFLICVRGRQVHLW